MRLTARMPKAALDTLASDPHVTYISLDRPLGRGVDTGDAADSHRGGAEFTGRADQCTVAVERGLLRLERRRGRHR